MQMVATSPADGSVIYGTTPTYINTSILSDPEYTYKDLDPVASVFIDPQIFYVRSESPFETLADALEHAEANPGDTRWGVTSPGSTSRQIVERLQEMRGLDLIMGSHDSGSETLVSVLNGSVDIGVGEVVEIAGQVAAGELRIVAVLGEERLPSFPDVPTAQEQGIDIVVKKFRGLAGPKGLPKDVLDAWAEAIPLLLADPEYQARYERDNVVPYFLDSEGYGALIEEFAVETEEYYREVGIIE
jgi:tripartite-type tricarboxylate transporter receptor subunit TctC